MDDRARSSFSENDDKNCANFAASVFSESNDGDDNEEARDFHRRFDRHAYEGHREILGENSRLKRRVTRLEAYSTQFCTKAAFAIYVRLIQLR